jgi:hypothetical protein
MRFRQWAGAGILVTACSGLMEAQQPAPAGALPEETRRNIAAPCLEPPPLVKWQDYRGPFQKVVGTFVGKVDRKSVHHPLHYRPDAMLCTLEVKDKLRLLVQNTFDPGSFFSAGYSASLDQAAKRYPALGEGAIGYARRFGYDFAGQSTGTFVKDFAYPTIFSEDPRYYRLGHGSRGKRLLHAMAYTFIAYRDSGKRMFNVSEWLGTGSAVALNDAYQPGNQHGFAPAMRQTGYSIMQDMGFAVFQEFWPEIARRLRMPFRDMQERPGTGPHH